MPSAVVVGDEELLRRYPDVRLDHDNQEYYRGLLNRELRLHRCADCGHWHGPPLRSLCPRCWSFGIFATPVRGVGRVELVTLLHSGRVVAGVSYEPPYPLVAVELPEQAGLRLSGTVRTDPAVEIRVGLAVRLSWEERGGNPYPVWEAAL